MRSTLTLTLPLLLSLLLVAAGHAAHAQGRPEVRRAEARDEVLKLFAGGNPQAALSRLQFLGEQRYAAQELIRGFEQVVADERRRNVAQVVAALGVPQAEAFCAELTRSPDGVLRMHGASGLGRIGSRQLGVLTPLLADRLPAVRREAAKALGQSKDKRAAKALVKAAKEEGDLEARQAMLIAIGQSGDRKQAAALAPFLEDSSATSRFAAARGLVLLGDKRGAEFAGKLLGSADRFERRQGLELYEGVPAKAARKQLEPVLHDPDKRVAAMAARILYQGGDAARLDWLVVASYLAEPADKLHFEAELETLMLTDDRRRAILKKAGVP